MSVWDDPEMKVSNDFISFDKVGDTASGTVQLVRAHRFTDGSVAPQILLTTDDGEEKTLTAGAVRLKAEMAEKRPEAGDHITVTLEREEPRGGGKTLRHWKVDVRRGGGQSPWQAEAQAQRSTPAQEPQQIDPAAAMAALGNLTDEQKRQLGINA